MKQERGALNKVANSAGLRPHCHDLVTMRFSIRYQLLLPLFILLLGVVGISAWHVVSSANRAQKQIEDDVRKVAATLSTKGFTLNRATLESMKSLTGADFVLLDAQGKVPVDPSGAATTLTTSPIALPPAVAVVDDWETLRLGPVVPIAGRPYLCSGIRLRTGLTLYILYPEALYSDALREAIQPALLIGVIGGGVAIALAVLLAQRLGRRIQELERRTRVIAAGDFSPMPLPQRNDELRDLSQSVNDMASRLAQLQEAIRKTERLRLLGQVSAGLAHQLRNGVTGARLAVQLHARKCDGQGDAEALEVALRQLSLVESNLKRFLDQGRSEELRKEPCDLAELLDEVIRHVGPQCRHSQIELAWQRPEGDWTIQGDTDQLEHVFHNLVSNAVEAAGPGGGVAIRLAKAEKSVVIEVWDSGPGPPPEIAARLFELFVTGKREGIGLGLAVAKQVTEAHGGKIDWRREGGRTCFRVELPVG